MAEFQKSLIRFLYVSLVVIAVLALIGLGKANRSGGAASRLGDGNPRGVTVTGTCVVRTKPELVEVNMGVSQSDKSAKAVQGFVRNTSAKVLQVLKSAGVAEKDVQTSEFSMTAEVNGKTGKNTGNWHAKEMLHVRIRDIQKAADIIDAAVGAGANIVNELEYAVEDMGKIRAEGRAKAAAAAHKKAVDLASSLGGKVGRLVSCSEDEPYGMSYGANATYLERAGSGGPGDSSEQITIQPGEMVTTVMVLATYEVE
ncbi:MAG: SIMPL domain-containing protein [Armatimonadota bacterium]